MGAGEGPGTSPRLARLRRRSHRGCPSALAALAPQGCTADLAPGLRWSCTLARMQRRPALWMAGVAFAGVVAGHSIAYVAAIPDASRRGALLAQTGHSYWGTALVAALLAEVLALAAVATCHFRAGLAAPAAEPLPIRLGGVQLAIRLSVIQVAAFTGLEVGERLVSRSE